MIHRNVRFSAASSPTASITINRNRLKSYGHSVYMKDGTNFEIELYNPTQCRVLVSIEIDGKTISSSGIVLNPAERTYLERWIDEPKKFLFSTYSVENTVEVKRAIALNGKVKVTFYEEVNKYFSPSRGNSGTIIVNPNDSGQPYWFNTGGSYNINYTTNAADTYAGSSFTSKVQVKGISNSQGSPEAVNSSYLASASLETGRAEMGASSDQNFNYTTGDFNSWPCATVEMQILPESQKPVEADKIRSYCTECGTRVRATSWKFCPTCGEKF